MTAPPPPTTPTGSPADLADALRQPAWALVRLQGEDRVTVLAGSRRDYPLLRDVPLADGPPAAGRRFDRLLCVPFRQIHERGYTAYDDGTPLTALEVSVETHASVDQIEALADLTPIRTDGPVGFETTDDEYAALVETVIEEDIGNGAGANLVVARDFRATLVGWDWAAALGVLCRLLRRERGAYWTFLVFTGERYLVGASPERHVEVRAGAVSMNPISGTFRLGDAAPAGGDLEPRLLRFLADEKEIFELFMVVDEELKMMCAICSDGGTIAGPFLKQMSHLVHTEYLLHGRTTMDLRDVLRDSMFAATVTGSPVENACRLIAHHEGRGRGYYGAMLALLGRDDDGAPTLDAPIVLRTADVSLDGALRVTAGATLVRDSVPASEVAETAAKAAGILSAFGLADAATAAPDVVTSLVESPRVLTALADRNRRLSRFWLDDQSGADRDARLAGRRVVVLDGEDDFVSMLGHLLAVLGMSSRVVSHREYRPGDLDDADLVIVGPGPGDPRELGDPKIATIRGVVDRLLSSRQRFLAVCLGHQVLCGALGLPLAYKDIVFQGTQTEVDLLGRRERVGFYNTFVARVSPEVAMPPGITVDSDPQTGDVHAVYGERFAGIQFHAESILTQHGFDLVRDLLHTLF